jgi:hypothetical protein
MKTKQMSLRILFTFARRAMPLLACAALCQCTHVPLMDRGKLADYTMKPDRDPLWSTLTEHIFFSREAASGGRAIGGGGCGCN